MKDRTKKKKMFEVQLCIQAYKTLIVEAEDEEDATELAYQICENEPIPIEPGDMPQAIVEGAWELTETED